MLKIPKKGQNQICLFGIFSTLIFAAGNCGMNIFRHFIMMSWEFGIYTISILAKKTFSSSEIEYYSF